jgi:hypothetical protein
MEPHEIRLIDLLESKPFEELSETDKAFVLEYMTETDFRLQQHIIHSTEELEYPAPTAVPLQANRIRSPWYKRSIPLYQVMAGAACLVIGILLTWPKETHGVRIQLAQQNIHIPTHSASGVQFIHDTLLQFVPGFARSEKVVHDTVILVQTILQPTAETRILEAGAINYPAITQRILESNSLSLKADKSNELLPRISSFNSFRN